MPDGPDRYQHLNRAREGDLRARLVLSAALESGKLARNGIGIAPAMMGVKK